MPGCPKINTAFVDVRDVADLHLRAMTNPAAKGQRFIAAAGQSIWLVEVGRILKRTMGIKADKVPVRELPNILLRIAALKDPMVKAMVPLLGLVMNTTNEKAVRMLGWSPRTTEEAISSAAESLICDRPTSPKYSYRAKKRSTIAGSLSCRSRPLSIFCPEKCASLPRTASTIFLREIPSSYPAINWGG